MDVNCLTVEETDRRLLLQGMSVLEFCAMASAYGSRGPWVSRRKGPTIDLKNPSLADSQLLARRAP